VGRRAKSKKTLTKRRRALGPRPDSGYCWPLAALLKGREEHGRNKKRGD
jgi:hypothetical protein